MSFNCKICGHDDCDCDQKVCQECNRRLRSVKSRQKGIGPVCNKKRQKRLFAEVSAHLNPALCGEPVPGGVQLAMRVPEGVKA